MNKQMWSLYKDSKRGKKSIETFNPETENIYQSINGVFEFMSKYENFQLPEDHISDWVFLLLANIDARGLAPEKWTRESYTKFIEKLDILEPVEHEDGTITFVDGSDGIILPNNKYRNKAALTNILSLAFYFTYEEFKPVLLPSRFDIIQRNCDSLGIELPDIPRTNDYMEYCIYYWDICVALNEFQKENDLTDGELCACVYDYAMMLNEDTISSELPKPTNVWFTGASGKEDFALLDSLGQEKGTNDNCIWACNERTRRGDIVIVYCTTPRSYIHSVWRSNSGGIFNPFDYYHCRTTVCDGVIAPHITSKELKSDSYMSQLPIVKKNLQGINGVELSSKDYSELLRMIGERGEDTSKYPKLFEGGDINFGDIKLEKDVEENILIPILKRLGYSESDWSRQLSQKAGRKEKAIPDFVFFPQGEKHFENAPMVIEAKLDMSPVQEMQKAFKQGLSYARMLRSSIMGICDKERLILYKIDKNGAADRSNPIFENHWSTIFSDVEVGAELNHLIGREVIKGCL